MLRAATPGGLLDIRPDGREEAAYDHGVLRKRFPEDPVVRLQYVYDKVLSQVTQDCTVHEVELLLCPWLRAAFPAGPDSIPRSSTDRRSDAEHLAGRKRVVL